jgi:hypothetical protein
MHRHVVAPLHSTRPDRPDPTPLYPRRLTKHPLDRLPLDASPRPPLRLEEPRRERVPEYTRRELRRHTSEHVADGELLKDEAARGYPVSRTVFEEVLGAS